MTPVAIIDTARLTGRRLGRVRRGVPAGDARGRLDMISRRWGLRRPMNVPSRSRPGPRRRMVAAVVVAVFAGVYFLGDAAPGIFVVPIALAAIEFGVLGGVTAGLLALALVVGWDVSTPHASLESLDYLSRAVAYVLLGGLLGRFVTRRRALESKIARSEQLSLDLMATANFDGYFTRLQRLLGAHAGLEQRGAAFTAIDRVRASRRS